MPFLPLSFTLLSKKISRALITPLDVYIPNTNKKMRLNGIWDTGATGTAITEKIVKKLGLLATGRINVITAGGEYIQNTYVVDIRLPNNVIVTGVTVNKIKSLGGLGNEILIGMNIITLGDFSVTNYNGKTCMSFRIPSMHEIDYTKNFKT